MVFFITWASFASASADSLNASAASFAAATIAVMDTAMPSAPNAFFIRFPADAAALPRVFMLAEAFADCFVIAEKSAPALTIKFLITAIC